MGREEEIIRILAVSLRRIVKELSSNWDRLEEIRLRVNAPLCVVSEGSSFFVSEQGRFCSREQARIVGLAELRETMEYVSSYSRSAFEEKIRQGFLTVPGGHRVGLAGRVVMEGKSVKTIAPVTFLSIRIAREVRGCAGKTVPWLWENGNLQDTRVISPPGLGKTTLLRDLIRLLSDGECGPACTVGVVDERSELAACYQGIPQNDLGSHTDVLDGCPKAEGMLMLVRSLAPQVIAVDEVGGEDDCRAIEYVMNCGCRLLATAHAMNWEELRRRPIFGRWIDEKRFGRYLLLERAGGQVRYRVCSALGRTLWQGEGRRLAV